MTYHLLRFFERSPVCGCYRLWATIIPEAGFMNAINASKDMGLYPKSGDIETTGVALWGAEVIPPQLVGIMLDAAEEAMFSQVWRQRVAG